MARKVLGRLSGSIALFTFFFVVIYVMKNMTDIALGYQILAALVFGHILRRQFIRDEELEKTVVYFLGLTGVAGVISLLPRIGIFLQAVAESATLLLAGMVFSICVRGLWLVLRRK